MKKALLILAIALMATFVLVACNGTEETPPPGETGGVDFTILMAKPEVAAQFEAVLAEYNRTSGNNATMIPLPAGQEVYQLMISLYAAGNAPALMMVGQEFDEFQEHFLDLTDTEFVSRAGAGTLDFVTVGGRVFGTPSTVEAYGIIYNPRIVEEVFGGGFDPAEIKTINELRDFFLGLRDAGVGPFSLSPMDWSLGAHLSNTLYAAQSENRDARHSFVEDLKAGTVTLADNAVFNGWMDVFDMLLEFNIHSGSPLAPVYEDGAFDLATGNAGAWFMGNWAFPMLSDIEALDYRFIPIPISNNASDFGNGKIAIGVPSFWCVDRSQNSEAQQQAAVDFLNWLITTDAGQAAYVNQLVMIPAYSGFAIAPDDSMSQQIAEFLNTGMALEWMNTYYPAGGFQAMGAAMQMYVGGIIDRAGLAREFESYWQTVN